MDRWTEEEIAEASKMWNEGHPASRIGAHMGRTREAICGIAHRHRDLFTRKEPKKASPSIFSKPSRSIAVAKKPATPKPSRWAKPAISLVDHHRSTKVAAAVKPERVPDFKPRKPVTILDLNSSTCRWPLWGMDENPGVAGRYCGELVDEGSVYCNCHRRLGAGLGTESERRAVKTLEKEAA